MLIADILDSGQKILSYTSGLTFEQFTDDNKTVDAVIRNFEIIGEAANRLPEEFKESHPEIDWHRIRGFRNRIIHVLFLIHLVNEALLLSLDLFDFVLNFLFL